MYNWKDASTPEGRERLIDLMDQGIRVVGKRKGQIDHFFYSDERMGGCYWIGKMTWKSLWNDVVINNDFIEVEFLDPEPPQTVDENGLLPCPFCGGKASIRERFGWGLDNIFIVMCNDGINCGSQSPPFSTKEKAIESWNKRA